MSKSLASAGLLALALSACAHANTPIPQTTWEYGGGRAAQPSGFLPSAQRASYAQVPVTTRTGMSYLGGQAGEPQAWLPGDAWQAKNTEAASCQMAGRASQPFSGPTLYAVEESAREKVGACRVEGGAW